MANLVAGEATPVAQMAPQTFDQFVHHREFLALGDLLNAELSAWNVPGREQIMSDLTALANGDLSALSRVISGIERAKGNSKAPRLGDILKAFVGIRDAFSKGRILAPTTATRAQAASVGGGSSGFPLFAVIGGVVAVLLLMKR